jgi:hypothetical protein
MHSLYFRRAWVFVIADLYGLRVRGACLEGQRCVALLAQTLMDWSAVTRIFRDARQGRDGPSLMPWRVVHAPVLLNLCLHLCTLTCVVVTIIPP